MTHFDVAIIGAGIAGTSLAAEMAGKRSVLILEAESLPGYHSTGRSAAFWSETYGGPGIQPLTSASGLFLASPPKGFADAALLRPRGALHLGTAADDQAAHAMLRDFASAGVTLEQLDLQSISARIPGLRDGWNQALWEPDCCDIDVAALHAGYIRQARSNGAVMMCNAELLGAQFRQNHWLIDAGKGQYSADVLVNAAGAWADKVAMACAIPSIGIQPYRRTIMQLAVEPEAPDDLPLVVGLDGSFYFKPESGGKLWLSPHDENATEACDAAPEELDIACAIDRFQQVVDWKVKRLERKWAGLRSFAPDRLPVIGRDPAQPAFFWLAGQGGFGIQTAPAIAQLAASLLLERSVPFAGIDAKLYAPDRLR